MGATFPFMMGHAREDAAAREESFSFLYAANVFGAMAGCLLTALVLVEILGFQHTLWVAAGGNFLIAIGSMVAATEARKRRRRPTRQPRLRRPASAAAEWDGFSSPPAWRWPWKWSGRGNSCPSSDRWSTPSRPCWPLSGRHRHGSRLYRRRSATRRRPWLRIRLAAACDPGAAARCCPSSRPTPAARSGRRGSADRPLAVAWASDRFAAFWDSSRRCWWTAGRAANPRAGRAYAVNTFGCILGPLVAGFLLLPLWASAGL